MVDAEIKFIFLKTPQIKHRFISLIKNKNFPVIRKEIYCAESVGNAYEFHGDSYSGAVDIDDFDTAIREGYVSLVLDS
jgi:hypothetical protein